MLPEERERADFIAEASRRSMHRLMATARSGRQPMDHGEAFEIVVKGQHGEASVSMQLSDTEAVLCGTDPCSWSREPQP